MYNISLVGAMVLGMAGLRHLCDAASLLKSERYFHHKHSGFLYPTS